VNHLVQGTDRHAMCPAKVPHRRVTTRHAHLNHRLVVLMKEQRGRAAKNDTPEVESWKALNPEPVLPGNNFRLWGAVRHAPLSLADAGKRETGVGPADAKVHPGRGPGRGLATSEIRVREQVGSTSAHGSPTHPIKRNDRLPRR
jgi:hypothetical protein